MTEEEKDEAISGAVEDCIDKAATILEDNQGGVRGLLAFHVSSKGISVHDVGHTMALDAACYKALQYLIKQLISLQEPDERR